MFQKRFLLPSLIALVLSACGSQSNNSNTFSFDSDDKSFLYGLFQHEYLWSDRIDTEVDTSAFTDPNNMIDALRVYPPDRWSFALNQEQFDAMINQKTAGFGIGFTPALEIFFVRIGSPAYGKLYRGDKIILVNGESATSSSIVQASQNHNRATTFSVLRNGNMIDVSVTPKAYRYSVTESKIINHNHHKIGYLRYDGFDENSVTEIEEDFSKFKAAGIDELVVDLRYNGGGTLAATSAFLDNIISSHPNERQLYLDWNDNNKDKNSEYFFEEASLQDGNELNMRRIFFLVTADSASASEAAINALVPYLGRRNVVTIGARTHGKPVGMEGRVYKDYMYFLVNFYVRNNAGETTSFDGIAPTCRATDDIGHRMGDTQEAMLATALYYIDHGRCP